MSSQTDFIFALYNRECLKFLKTEISLAYPELRLSFSRPGFITLKGGLQNKNYHFLFARITGRSLGKFLFSDDHLPLTKELTKIEYIHVYQLPIENKDVGPELDDLLLILQKKFPQLKKKKINQKVPVGQDILDLIFINKNEIWLGRHQQQLFSSPYPGGDPQHKLPELAPSRVYLKAWEAHEIFQIPWQKRDIILEIGCAPGGMSWYFLRHGLEVIGVDSAVVDEKFLSQHGSFTFIHHKAQNFSMPNKEVQWLIIDLNLQAESVLPMLSQVSTYYKQSLRGLLWNLKLAETSMISKIPKWLAELKKMGWGTPQLCQLKSSAQEICVFCVFKRQRA